MEIMMENTSYGTSDGSPYVIGNPKAPYINNTLIGADKYTSLTNWYSIEHNSPLDYMDAISGCDHNGYTRPYLDPTLVNELDGVGTTWKAYMDGLAAGQNCYLGHGAGTNGYVQNHNPFIYFKQIISNTSECDANVVPYFLSGMSSDLNSSSPPDFVWITPSVCDDMHSRCAPLNNLVAQGDTWLANNLPTVLASKWYTQGNGIVIITWDEGAKTDVACPPWVPTGTSCGGHIATLVITQNSCGSFSGSGDQFGILHGIEAAYGVDYLNNSGGLTWNPIDDITPALCLGSSPPAIVQQTVAAAKATSTTFSVTTPSTPAGDLLAITTEFDAGSGHASGSVIGVTDNMTVGWLTMIPYISGGIGLVGWGLVSDRMNERRWNLRIDNAIDVLLPEESPDAAWARLAALERANGVLKHDIQTVDMRLPDRLVLRAAAPPPKEVAPAKKPRPSGKST